MIKDHIFWHWHSKTNRGIYTSRKWYPSDTSDIQKHNGVWQSEAWKLTVVKAGGRELWVIDANCFVKMTSVVKERLENTTYVVNEDTFDILINILKLLHWYFLMFISQGRKEIWLQIPFILNIAQVLWA